jgi:hypothetical protein
MGRDVDPGDRLLVDRAGVVIADGPVQEVLERPGERSRIFGGREDDRVGGPDPGSQVGDGTGERIAIVVGVEMRQATAIKDVLPRIVFAAIAVNASLSVAGLIISTADSLSEAVLGQGVDPAQATVVLRQLVLGSLADGGIFVVLLGGVVAVLAIVLLATYVVRLALVILLIVAAPICLVCHALPQTEGLAKLWWRAFAGTLAVQVAQSLVLITALRVFLASGGPSNLGIASTGGLVDLLVSACLCWVLVKIPGWVSRVVFSRSGGHGGMGRIVRDVIVYKGAKALAAGVGL